MVKLKAGDARPIYRQLEDQFLELLRARKLRAHALLPPAVELGQTLGISHLTVRQAYGRLAERGLVYSIRGKGTFVAAPAAPRPPTLALTVPFEFFRSPGSSGVYAAMADLLYRLARADGKLLKLIVLTTPYADQVRGDAVGGGAGGRLNAHDVAAISECAAGGVFVAGHHLPPDLMRRLKARGVPVVAFCDGAEHRVVIDAEARYRMPLSYAHSRGRKHVGLIHLDLGDHPKLKHVLLRAMRRAGFDPDPKRIVGVGSASMSAGQAAAEYLLDTQRKLDAILCYDDLLAQGMCVACVKRHVDVPGSILLVAHANKGVTAPFLLPVARVQVDVEAMMRSGYAKMSALLGEPRAAVQTGASSLRPTLVPEHSRGGDSVDPEAASELLLSIA